MLQENENKLRHGFDFQTLLSVGVSGITEEPYWSVNRHNAEQLNFCTRSAFLLWKHHKLTSCLARGRRRTTGDKSHSQYSSVRQLHSLPESVIESSAYRNSFNSDGWLTFCNRSVSFNWLINSDLGACVGNYFRTINCWSLCDSFYPQLLQAARVNCIFSEREVISVSIAACEPRNNLGAD